ncbi:hypothetical protein HK098_002367 [Nowakowskiella sp. JEL0407]|nr:hypothetical protein HK098_002367 [Nowakowskiella sp. JEL0407]
MKMKIEEINSESESHYSEDEELNDVDEEINDDNDEEMDVAESATEKDAEAIEKSRQSRAAQKALLKQRKEQKQHGEILTQAKSIWEQLRQRNAAKKDRERLMEKMMKLIQGHVQDIIFKHDASRIIQTCLKYGNAKQRGLIATELKGKAVELSSSKYGRFIVLKILNYCPQHRADLIKEFYGQVRKLMRHREASVVLEEIYAQYANSQQRSLIVEEFYGPEFSVFKSLSGTKSLNEILQTDPSKAGAVLKFLQESLNHLLSKSAVDITSQTIVHRLLHEFLTTDAPVVHSSLDNLLNPKAREESSTTETPKKEFQIPKGVSDMMEFLKEQLVNILHTRDGARVSQLCILYATPKDRKQIIKTVKEFVVKISREQYGHTVLLTLFESVDDTVLVQKAILGTLFDPKVKDNDVRAMIKDRYASRVLLFLLCGRNRKYLPSFVVEELEEYDKIRKHTSKKDDEIKTRELREWVIPQLLSVLENDTEEFLKNKNSAQVMCELLWSVKDDRCLRLIKKIAEAAKGTVEEYDAGVKSAEEAKVNQALGDSFHAVKKLKVKFDAEKKDMEKIQKYKNKMDVDDDESDDELPKKPKMVEDEQDESGHVLVNRTSTLTIKTLISGERGPKLSLDANRKEAQENTSKLFSKSLQEAISKNVSYWLNRCVEDPARSNGTAFIFLALLESESIGKSTVDSITAISKDGGFEKKLLKAVATAKENGKQEGAGKKRKSTADGATEKGKVIVIEQVWQQYKSMK